MVEFGDPRLPQRFWDKVVPEPNTGCWLWLAQLSRGYARFRWNGRQEGGHRISYRELVSEIPLGLQIDHLCRTPSCVNPDHLEAVTPAVNTQRGNSGKHNSAKIECPQGHKYTPENTRILRSGSRVCRRCVNDRTLARQQTILGAIAHRAASTKSRRKAMM